MTILPIIAAALLVVTPMTDTATRTQDTQSKGDKIICEATRPAYDLTETEIDLIANVVTHEVGGMGEGVSVRIEYADGRTERYTDGSILRRIHAKVLLNQLGSDLFPDTLDGCISRYWAAELTSATYYNRNYSLWQQSRADVVEVVQNGLDMPDTVFGATQDPCFGTRYPAYSRWATVTWDTGWARGTYYYYQYNGG